MAVQTHLIIQEFDRLAALPENAARVLENIVGELFEVPSNAYGSKIAGIILGELYIFLKGKNLGHLTGEAGGYMVSGERYAPEWHLSPGHANQNWPGSAITQTRQS